MVRLLDRQISQLGGQEIEADAPLERMPLFVRAGSILPMGPQIEYAAQDPAGPIELRIYRGADGKFDLYEDGGDGYEYEKGEHSLSFPFAGTIAPAR
jgi:alpha-D-xyloside xylohydrolase